MPTIRSGHTGGSVAYHREGVVESMSTDGLEWRRSSRCNGGACVEVAAWADRVFVRNSGDPDGPVLVLDWTRWADFVSRVQGSRTLDA
jgi:Domain of unknown function (DUF397)